MYQQPYRYYRRSCHFVQVTSIGTQTELCLKEPEPRGDNVLESVEFEGGKESLVGSE